MRVKFSLYQSTTLEREIESDRFPLTIGRSQQADICLNDRWASRRHCQLSVEEGVLVVRDLASKHGTLVNDRPVSEASLQSGDRLVIGLSHLVVELFIDDESSASALPMAGRQDAV